MVKPVRWVVKNGIGQYEQPEDPNPIGSACFGICFFTILGVVFYLLVQAKF